MTGTHDSILVALSLGVAALASYTALDLAGRASTAVGGARRAWLGAAAVAMGGGIWAMHFIAMLAFQLPVAVAYDPLLTLASLVLPIVVTGGAFLVVSARQASLPRLLGSGLAMGAAIAAMHYLGMAAMRVPADLRYEPGLVAASLLIAVGAATVALWLAFRRRTLAQQLGATAVMAVAITGMHYTAMHAAHFSALGPTDGAGGQASLAQVNLAVGVASTTVLILFLGLVAALFDRRFAGLAEREAEALRASEERFRTLYRESPLPLHSLDRDGVVEHVSDAWLDLVGRPREAVIGRPFAEFLAPDSLADGRPAYWERLLREEVVREEELRLATRAGAPLDVLLSERVQRGPDGAFLRTLGGLVDVTERRRAEEALRQAQRMEAMGQLTGGVAHDFNNLLMVIGGSADMLERGNDPARRLAMIRQAVERGQGLTKQLLAFSRRQSLDLSVIDLHVHLPRMRELLERSLRGDIEVEIRVAEDLWLVEVDVGELELALLNLAVNARDAMPGGGRLLIEAANVLPRRGSRASLPGGLDGEFVRVAVTDTGTGIPPDVASRVFEPFFTTKEVGKGSGLGLSQVYGFARQSGGAAVIDSAPGAGTTVSLYLPRTRRALQAPAAREAEAARDAAARGRVLLVEDDPAVAVVTEGLLVQIGYAVEHVEGAREALDRLARGLPADLVVSDIIMPGGMNGHELAVEIATRHPGLPVLLTTGYNAAENRAAGSAFPVLRKPYRIEELDRAIDALLARPGGMERAGA